MDSLECVVCGERGPVGQRRFGCGVVGCSGVGLGGRVLEDESVIDQSDLVEKVGVEFVAEFLGGGTSVVSLLGLANSLTMVKISLLLCALAWILFWRAVFFVDLRRRWCVVAVLLKVAWVSGVLLFLYLFSSCLQVRLDSRRPGE